MQKYFEILKTVQLFKGINHDDLAAMLSCLKAKIVKFSKDEFVLVAGNKPEHIGIVLDGGVQVVKEDANGERILLAAFERGEFFAEALCCAGVLESPVSVVASVESSVMLIEFNKILHNCPSSCTFHTRLIENMLFIIAQKNLFLGERLDILGKKTLRLKVICYLETLLTRRGGDSITIPFNREELADFLCVDRSALSHELSRMKKDGVLDYHKNRFTLKTPR